VHKPLFPFYGKEVAGVFVLTLTSALSNVAGGGGGGVMISLVMVFFDMNIKEAIAIDSFSALLVNISRYIFAMKDKHPQKDSVIIDYSLSFVVMPAIFASSLLGAYLNNYLPSLIILLV
jgi:uncharacterized membrane protein YfcA